MFLSDKKIDTRIELDPSDREDLSLFFLKRFKTYEPKFTGLDRFVTDLLVRRFRAEDFFRAGVLKSTF